MQVLFLYVCLFLRLFRSILFPFSAIRNHHPFHVVLNYLHNHSTKPTKIFHEHYFNSNINNTSRPLTVPWQEKRIFPHARCKVSQIKKFYFEFRHQNWKRKRLFHTEITIDRVTADLKTQEGHIAKICIKPPKSFSHVNLGSLKQLAISR